MFALILKIVLTRFLDMASIVVLWLRSPERVYAGFTSVVLSLLGLIFFIYSLIRIPQDGMWLILLAILSLLWMGLWVSALYLAITSPTWPPPERS